MRIRKHWLRLIALTAVASPFLLPGPVSAAPITSGYIYSWAPMLRLHPNEDLWPLSPLTTIDISTHLRWAHDGTNCTRDYNLANPDRSDLGDGAYGHRTKSSDCDHGGSTWKSNKYTTPYEHYTLGGWASPGGGEGFFLDIPTADRDGGDLNGDEPVIVRAVAGKWVQYWYHFGDSRRPTSGAGHEGDWEHIAVKLSGNTPLRVEYSYHHSKCELPWASAPKVASGSNAGQLIVYIARRSHASYPWIDSKPASFSGGGTDQIGAGPWWDAQRNLNSLPNYSFYPYGGGWGQSGNSDDSSGPSSPGPWRGAPIFNTDKATTSDDDPTCTRR